MSCSSVATARLKSVCRWWPTLKLPAKSSGKARRRRFWFLKRKGGKAIAAKEGTVSIRHAKNHGDRSLGVLHGTQESGRKFPQRARQPRTKARSQGFRR